MAHYCARARQGREGGASGRQQASGDRVRHITQRVPSPSASAQPLQRTTVSLLSRCIVLCAVALRRRAEGGERASGAAGTGQRTVSTLLRAPSSEPALRSDCAARAAPLCESLHAHGRMRLLWCECGTFAAALVDEGEGEREVDARVDEGGLLSVSGGGEDSACDRQTPTRAQALLQAAGCSRA